ncbi:MAG TPA: hypothetical protein GYA07_08585 [Verrucomicrobia bacterium]|nr:hypothetical protein [Verrucomicrobiota bacterium]HOP97108.1 hypothetical protein [Verrucomicrobiota bacterium]HPU56773.1 hypothetical protein [Verrucomicrobiota bacterium]
MIRNFEPAQPLEPDEPGHVQWWPALAAGLIAGLVLFVAPRGSPWSTLTFFAPVIVGRTVPETMGIAFPAALVIHLGASLLYGVIISVVAARFAQLRSLIAGAVAGLILYCLNLGIVTLIAPELRGNEIAVLFTHVVFGLIAGGAYRGLLRRAARKAETWT